MGKVTKKQHNGDLQRSIKKCERYFALLEKHIKNMYTIENEEDTKNPHEVETSHKRLFAKECEVKLLQSELSDKMKCIENLHQQIKEVEYVSFQKSQDMRKMCSKFDKFKNSVESIRIHNEQLEITIMKLERQLNYIYLEYRVLQGTIENKDSYINELQLNVERLEQQKESVQSEILRLQESVYLLIGIIINASQSPGKMEDANEIDENQSDSLSKDLCLFQNVEDKELQKGLSAVKEIRRLMTDNGYKKMQNVLHLVQEPKLFLLKNTIGDLLKLGNEMDDEEKYSYSVNGRRN